jgi:hypothetical protein
VGGIRGTVTSSKGPEAGVWVAAETEDLPARFRKIVVTDIRGRYALPDLPAANHKISVRGYGRVDSQAVEAKPGTTALALTSVIAPDAWAEAQYYAAICWFSLLQVHSKSEFPMPIPATDVRGAGVFDGPPTREVRT